MSISNHLHLCKSDTISVPLFGVFYTTATLFILTILVASACFAGDIVLKVANHDLLRALLDNTTHAIVAVLSWLVFLRKCHKPPSVIGSSGFELFLSGIFASAIDIDHFILAKSFELKNALNLGRRRPPLHCTTLPLVILAACLVVGWFYDSPKVRRFGWLTWVSIFSHHIRDGFRRGIWLWPFNSTPPIPYYLYLLITIALPYLVMMPLKEGDISYMNIESVLEERSKKQLLKSIYKNVVL